MASILKTFLREFGVRNVFEASDGAEALERIFSSNPDLVILDCNMPSFDGISFTKMVRTASDSPNRHVPIIMVTAYSERGRILEVRDAGVDEILVKPVSAVEIYRRVIEVIERPRPFTETKSYVGPSRRRRTVADRRGPDRRNPEQKAEAG